ncbi:PAS domain S-box protein [filamentous cyanobacterium LEGE 11480]|uniref:Circadian input-output histidine kinase CikA n=1 Tax=Romeriopsis navalis LEGE 11480 TaxID=2777977 RepID=A0A928Z2A6_9CYAN|nr:PAS domain S-box protein [Romeriopsis navalis]MBE9028832.1 PAS domain S-box protein [Romeriopsis navalis LEGE 11480]
MTHPTPVELGRAIARNPLLVSPDAAVIDVIDQMHTIRAAGMQRQLGNTLDSIAVPVDATAVVVEHHLVIGLLTEQDILRLAAQQLDLTHLTMRTVMTHPVITLPEPALVDVSAVMQLLQQHQIHHLPLVDRQNRVTGLITYERLCQLAINQQLWQSQQQLQIQLDARIQAETSQQASEQRYADFLTVAPVGIFHTDTMGKCLYVNERWCEIAGLTLTEALGDGWLNGLHPADRALIGAEWNIAAQENQPFQLEYRFQRADACVTWVYGQAVAEYSPHGELLGYVGTITDITDRKQSEITLQNLVAGTAATTGQDFFPVLVEHIATAVDVSYVLVSELLDETLHVMAYWADGKLQPTFSFPLSGTPCEQVLQNAECYIDDCVQSQFPEDLDLVEMSAQSYLGVALYDLLGQPIGNLCILDKRPLRDVQRAKQILQVFAARAGVELERQRASIALKNRNKDLETAVQDRTKALKLTQSAVDLADDAIYMVRMDGSLSYVNQSACKMLGYSQDELLSLSVQDIDLYRPLDDFSEQWQSNCQERSWPPFETQHRAKDGTIHTVEVSVNYFEQDGQTYNIVFVRDICDRKEAAQKIQQQAEYERLLREISQRIRQSLDLQTIFDTACQEIRQVLQADRVGIFRLEPNSPVDTGEFVAEAVVESAVSLLSQSFSVDDLVSFDAPFDRQAPFWVETNLNWVQLPARLTQHLARWQIRANLVMPLLYKDELWGLLVVHQCYESRHWHQTEIDLTQQLANQLAIAIQQAELVQQLQQELSERQQTQQQLTERNQQLAQSNDELAYATRLKSEFLATMSHELRTPLNAVLGLAEALQDQIFGELNPKQIKALTTIERSGVHLLSLINDILDVAKIEAGRVKLQRSMVTVESVCRSSLAFIRQQALRKEIRLGLKLPPESIVLNVDERRISQALINLLSNAVKFTPEQGAIALEVTLPEVSPDHNVANSKFVEIAVSDTGIGIAPEYMPQLFKPFVQIDSALNRKYEGTGLGLALVKQLVELHGGAVRVSSEMDVGSRFTIELPYSKIVPQPDIATSRVRSSVIEPPCSRITKLQPRILLAEDNASNVSVIADYLSAAGCQLQIAHNGQIAIDLAQAETPDVILMDIQMPVVDGLEAMQKMRRDPNLVNVPIIALTALAMPGDRERCFMAGATDYLSKPVRLKQMVETIERYLA